MLKNSAVNLDITNNSDGYDISGGTTKRKLTITGADTAINSTQITLGTKTFTMPSASDTVVGRTSTDTLTNKTLTSPVINVASDATGDIYYRNASGAFTRLPIGTSGYLLTVSSGLPAWLAPPVVHTQNTDTGTTSTTFQIDSGNSGPKLKNSSGVVQLRNSADSAYADLEVGNLTVKGTTATINSTTITVDDKNLELGSVDTPTDTTADGGGITLKGATDKTINWLSSNSAWNLSEHMNLVSTKYYMINGVKVLDATTLGATVVTSSLTALGTITTGVWNASVLGLAYGGSNANLSAVNGGIVYSTASAMAISAAGTSGQVLQSNGAAAPTWVTPALGETWSEISTATTAIINNMYICNHATTRVVVTLPATAVIGSKIKICGKGAAGWQVTAPTSATIRFGNCVTATAGNIQSTNPYDTIELVCSTANTVWSVLSAVGNITIN